MKTIYNDSVENDDWIKRVHPEENLKELKVHESLYRIKKVKDKLKEKKNENNPPKQN